MNARQRRTARRAQAVPRLPPSAYVTPVRAWIVRVARGGRIYEYVVEAYSNVEAVELVATGRGRLL